MLFRSEPGTPDDTTGTVVVVVTGAASVVDVVEVVEVDEVVVVFDTTPVFVTEKETAAERYDRPLTPVAVDVTWWPPLATVVEFQLSA